MDRIWVNRLIEGTKTWADLPAMRRDSVKALLAEKVSANEITAERYAGITGETISE